MDIETEKLEQNEIHNHINYLQGIVILFGTLLLNIASCLLYRKNIYESSVIVILTILGTFTTTFMFYKEDLFGTFLFENHTKKWRFVIVYFICLLLSLLFPLLPETGWPYLPLFLALYFFSGQLTALFGGSTLLLQSVLLSGQAEHKIFFIYFVSGALAIILFSHIEKEFIVGKPVIITLMIHFLTLCVYELIIKNSVFSFELFMIPLMNLAVSLILMLVLLKYISVFEIFTIRDIYMEINDPEHPLLTKLKEYSKDDYFHAVHTAYLCDRVTDKLHLDRDVAKAAGYYHKIGILEGKNNIENLKKVIEPYHFPDPTIQVLMEYVDEKESIKKKESAILMICDTLVASITYYFHTGNENPLDYEKLIQTIFQKKLSSGVLNESEISITEIEQMKKILVEEKLYYDFLR